MYDLQLPSLTDGPATIDAVLLLEGFHSVSIPARYAPLIAYSEEIFDTTTVLYLPEEKSARGNADDLDDSLTSAFGIPPYPRTPPGADNRIIVHNDSVWWWERMQRIEAGGRDASLRAMVIEAAGTAIARNASSPLLEDLAERYASPDTHVELLRRAHLMGCGMFNPWRHHTLHLALAAARARRWEVLIRAHLAIIDNPAGPLYKAQPITLEGRSTFMRELEAFGLNTVDLVLGAALDDEHVDRRHCVGSVGPMGYALSECRDTAAVTARVLAMVRDPELDPPNRIALFELYAAFIWGLPKPEAERRIAELKNAAMTFPAFLAKEIEALPMWP